MDIHIFHIGPGKILQSKHVIWCYLKLWDTVTCFLYLHNPHPHPLLQKNYLHIEITQTWFGGSWLTVFLQRNLLTFPCLFNSICISLPSGHKWYMINHFLSIIPVKIHSDQFWENFFWLGFVFLKVIVQYKIHTTIFNFGNLQKKDFMPFN